jgi:purine-binding chemotaxis protein CheW
MLVTRVGSTACAFLIEHVIEIMRPLPVEPLARASAGPDGGLVDPALAMIDGLAMIRGVAIPVVDVRTLLGITGGRATRVVVVRVADRQLAVLVDDVIGVQHFDQAQLSPLPALLRGARRDSVAAIGTRDAALLVVLDSARVLPEDSWRALDRDPGGDPGPRSEP